MEYYTADSYKNAERIGEPFDINGKLYSHVKIKCDRCVNGIYAVGVENGQIKPHPNYNGICLKCKGVGYLTKDVRLYTEHEYELMQKRNAAAKERKEQKREKQMKAEFAHNKELWLSSNGFDAEGNTYIITGDTFSIKDTLKNAGFRYDGVLGWHGPDNTGYEDRSVKINVNDYFEFSAWGKGYYITGAKDKIQLLLNGGKAISNSDFVGEVGKKIKTNVILKKKSGFYNKWNQWNNIYTFEDADNNILIWFTTVELHDVPISAFPISATVKDHKDFKGTKQTILTRVQMI